MPKIERQDSGIALTMLIDENKSVDEKPSSTLLDLFEASRNCVLSVPRNPHQNSSGNRNNDMASNIAHGATSSRNSENTVLSQLTRLVETTINSVRQSIWIEREGEKIGKSFAHQDVMYSRAAAFLAIVDEYEQMTEDAKKGLSMCLKNLPGNYYHNAETREKTNISKLPFDQMIKTIINGPCLQSGTNEINRIAEYLEKTVANLYR